MGEEFKVDTILDGLSKEEGEKSLGTGHRYIYYDIETGVNENYLLYKPVFEIKTPTLLSRVTKTMTQDMIDKENAQRMEDARKDAEKKEKEWEEDAALSAITNKVVAIGFAGDGDTDILDALGLPNIENDLILEGDEKYILKTFWNAIKNARRLAAQNINVHFVGFNIRTFDNVVITRRTWLNGEKIPFLLNDRNEFIDLYDVWRGTSSRETKDYYISNDNLRFILGLERKKQKGKDFAKLLETDRAAAIDYLKGDVLIGCREIHKRLSPEITL